MRRPARNSPAISRITPAINVARPEVIIKKDENGDLSEPFEVVTIDVMEEHQGGIMEKIGLRKGELTDMAPDGKGRVRMDFMMIKSREATKQLSHVSGPKFYLGKKAIKHARTMHNRLHAEQLLYLPGVRQIRSFMGLRQVVSTHNTGRKARFHQPQ